MQNDWGWVKTYYHLWGNRHPAIPAMTSGAYAPGVSIVMGVPQELDGNGKSPENMDENRGDPHFRKPSYYHFIQ